MHLLLFKRALGLAEVLFALGQERLDKLMPDVIATTMKTELSPNIRDGYLMLYIYLPSTFGEDFTEYIGPIIPPILKVSFWVLIMPDQVTRDWGTAGAIPLHFFLNKMLFTMELIQTL